MALQILASSSYVVENLFNSTPLEWSEFVNNEVVIPEGSWFSTGQLQLQLQLFMSVTTNVEVAKRGTERYINPTQLQYGHVAALSEGFVLWDDRIKYQKQAHTWESAITEISNTIQDARLDLGLTVNSKAGHAQSSATTQICGVIRGLTPPPPTPAALDLSGAIGLGGLCLKTALGETQFSQQDPFRSNIDKEVTLNLRELVLPDEFRGILWGGHRLEVGWLLGYHQTASSAQAVPSAVFVRGEVKPAPFAYQCEFGLPVPAPNSCPPGTAPVLWFDSITGETSILCLNTTLE